MRKTIIAAALTLTFAAIGAAAAQTPSVTTTEKPAATAVTKPDTTSDADKRAKAADCSKQADAKKLHGAAREKFRASCKKA